MGPVLELSQNLLTRARLIHRAWRYRLKVERPEVAFLLEHLRPGQVALDIGAHKGAFTYWMSKLVGPTGRVFAFEPIPHLAAYLTHVKEVYPFKQLTVVEAALSNTEGKKTFFIPKEGYLGTAALVPKEKGYLGIPVRTCTVDQFSRDNPVDPINFIKCDVEGHELEVFEGGEQVLRRDRPILLFECVDFLQQGGQIGRVFPYLESLGYKGYFFPRGRTRPVTEFRVQKHQSQMGPDWCVNFGFLPGRAA